MHYKTRSTKVLSLKERTDVGKKTGNYFKTKRNLLFAGSDIGR